MFEASTCLTRATRQIISATAPVDWFKDGRKCGSGRRGDAPPHNGVKWTAAREDYKADLQTTEKCSWASDFLGESLGLHPRDGRRAPGLALESRDGVLGIRAPPGAAAHNARCGMRLTARRRRAQVVLKTTAQWGGGVFGGREILGALRSGSAAPPKWPAELPKGSARGRRRRPGAHGVGEAFCLPFKTGFMSCNSPLSLPSQRKRVDVAPYGRAEAEATAWATNGAGRTTEVVGAMQFRQHMEHKLEE